jgi:hypothetical protein
VPQREGATHSTRKERIMRAPPATTADADRVEGAPAAVNGSGPDGGT